jgi:putative hydrolase of HD superfamily
MLERLKTTKREGWRRFNIMDGESISDHMYRMSILTMLAPPSISQKLNIPLCTKMALIHDMAELLVGDITPVDNVPKQEKSRREEETMDYLCKSLLGKVDGGDSGEEIRRVWREYEDSETPEAIFVHDIDKIELLLQMVEYERARRDKDGKPLELDEFSYVAKKIALPEMRDWATEILNEREAFWADINAVPADRIDPKAELHKKQLDEYYGKDKQ